jgi:TonB-dependent SusC/RagA subfamily outer membrane receptor
MTAEDITKVRVRRVEELLAGRFPGVLVLPTATGGWIVRIRSSAPDRPPLYVVDGQPVEVSADRGLDWLNPADIERIDILRDPAETSMFGGRGANGVVLIKTKIRLFPPDQRFIRSIRMNLRQGGFRAQVRPR